MSNAFVDDDALQTYTDLATIKYREIFATKQDIVLPNVPTVNGTYQLKCRVTSEGSELFWELLE